MSNPQLLIGRGESLQLLDARYANRHGLIAGATGTGKTVTLQVLAEGFSAIGVPVFAVDIKGDLSGIAAASAGGPKLEARAEKTGLTPYTPTASPAVFWDVFGEKGHPLRATVSDLGPLLFARLLDLSDIQASVLSLAFRYADDQGLLLLDLKDLKALLSHLSAHAKELGADYGLVSSASVGAIQRALLELESAGGSHFFGEPALELGDLLRTDLSGRGLVHLLAADRLFLQPRLYAAVLLWLLSELYEQLPEQGDADKPRLALFLDEAHLLFKDAPRVLVDKIEQVVRLIRSKGVGLYFVTQNPLDLPETVLAQLGNRVQHALRAFTPRDQKAVRAAAETFRANPKLDVASAITELGVGEALVSTLGDNGIPSPVERTFIRPPQSRIGALSDDDRRALMERSPVRGRYDQLVDRESAYERLSARAQPAPSSATNAPPRDAAPDWKQQVEDAWGGSGRSPRPSSTAGRPTRRGDTATEAAVKSVVRSIGSSVGREIGKQLMRGLLGSLRR
jgi:DNA helicase HerA-like ATPase